MKLGIPSLSFKKLIQREEGRSIQKVKFTILSLRLARVSTQTLSSL
jgi:hypothetical protein